MPLSVELIEDNVGLIVLQDPPYNYTTPAQIDSIAEALESFDGNRSVRAAVLAADGRCFSAGKNLDPKSNVREVTAAQFYSGIARIFGTVTPVVAAVHGPAIGGGLGLALTASFRVTCPEARFSAPFVSLGVHHGFGLTVTLPDLVGPSKAGILLLTGRRINGEEATELGLADLCVPVEQVRATSIELAAEIAKGAPLAIRAIQRTLRVGLSDRVRAASEHEAREQTRLSGTEDALEGSQAVRERRVGLFRGR